MKTVILNNQAIEEHTVAAIGFFDGVHLAHKELIKKTIEIGNKKALKKAVITFDVHPKSILFDLDYYYLTPLEEKIKLFKQFDLDVIYIIEFSKKEASLTPEQFINKYLKKLDTIVCGFDFKFGVRGSGNVKTLLTSPFFKTEVVKEVTYEGYKVGSTHIRDLIRSGQVDKVKAVLGNFYTISGEVVHGAKKGRMIGYPTANLETDGYFLPRRGVYITLTKVDNEWYQSMTSIGHNPTLNCRIDLSVETYLLNFDQELYGKTLEIKFIKRIRDEVKFSSIEELIKEIDKDKQKTITYFKNN